jgi:hypothetical protein
MKVLQRNFVYPQFQIFASVVWSLNQANNFEIIVLIEIDGIEYYLPNSGSNNDPMSEDDRLNKITKNYEKYFDLYGMRTFWRNFVTDLGRMCRKKCFYFCVFT